MSFLTRRPLDASRAAAAVRGPGRGGVVVFEGRVRAREAGVPICSIIYAAYRPMAERQLTRICRESAQRWKAAVFLRHRVGRVPAGALSIVIACASAHRREAFAACRFIIDSVKKRVPIWKVRFDRKESPG